MAREPSCVSGSIIWTRRRIKELSKEESCILPRSKRGTIVTTSISITLLYKHGGEEKNEWSFNAALRLIKETRV
jgi:hypothetical protein